MDKTSKIIEITEQDMGEFITSESPQLLDLFAPWCNPCKIILPILDELAHEYESKIKFAKVNIEESDTARDMMAHYNIIGVPAVLILGNGKGGFIVGAKSKEFYRNSIEEVLKTGGA